MLRPRLIPFLLLSNGGLVKTTKFKDPKYVGDPLNTVRLFNEKDVDELAIFDIDASREGRQPNYGLLERLAAESRMPLCYGGGVKNASQALAIVKLGIEKISLSSLINEDIDELYRISDKVGSQSVVATLDVKRNTFGSYEVQFASRQKKSDLGLEDLIINLQKRGVGEIVINSIDRDGTLEGYDLELGARCRQLVDCPLTIVGGAGSLSDFRRAYLEHDIRGLGAGSFFVLKGRYRAVLVSYPPDQDRSEICQWG